MEEEMYPPNWVKEKKQHSSISTKPSLSILGGHNYQSIDWTLVNQTQPGKPNRPRRSTFSIKRENEHDNLIVCSYIVHLNKAVISQIIPDEQNRNTIKDYGVEESFAVPLQPLTKPSNGWTIKNKFLADECFEILHNFSSENYFEIVHSSRTKMKVRRVLTDNIFKVLCNFCFMTSSNFIELEMKLTDTFLELNVTPKVPQTQKYVDAIETELWKGDLIVLEEGKQIQYFMNKTRQRIQQLRIVAVRGESQPESSESLMKQYLHITRSLIKQFSSKEQSLSNQGRTLISTRIFQSLKVEQAFQKQTRQNNKKVEVMKIRLKNKGLPSCLQFLQINSVNYNIDLEILPFTSSTNILDRVEGCRTPEQKLLTFKQFYDNLKRQSQSITKSSESDLITPLVILAIVYSNTSSLFRDTKMMEQYLRLLPEKKDEQVEIINIIQNALNHIKDSFFQCL